MVMVGQLRPHQAPTAEFPYRVCSDDCKLESMDGDLGDTEKRLGSPSTPMLLYIPQLECTSPRALSVRLTCKSFITNTEPPNTLSGRVIIVLLQR